jgi:hypothetical protein
MSSNWPRSRNERCLPIIATVKTLPFVLALLVGPWTAGPGRAQAVPEIFRDADLVLGERLIAEHKCNECHARKAGGDGSAIYRPRGRIVTAGLLRGMVEQCNTELNLALFPEEVTAIAAVLNRDHYRHR